MISVCYWLSIFGLIVVLLYGLYRWAAWCCACVVELFEEMEGD